MAATPMFRRWTLAPLIALGMAALLLVAGIALAVVNEQMGRAQNQREVEIQARIVADSVAAPLAFDDVAAARDYLSALRANPQVVAAGAYDLRGRLVAGFNTPDAVLPATPPLPGARMPASRITVTAPVKQGATRLGTVYLQTAREPWAHRVMRYVGVGVLVVMASLVLTILAVAGRSLAAAHNRLQLEVVEREKAQEALRQSQKMEAMGQLTGGVAHDFNNLLMVASSGLDLLERTKDPARIEKLKQGIRHAIDRGASLTQQLLAFSRREPMNPEVIDLAARLNRVLNLLERSLRANIRVRLTVEAGLWPVEVDPAQLEVAILNLAVNARDAMPQGGTIDISARNDPQGGADRVRIEVKDTGVGLPPELHQRVFEPFFTTKGVGEGTGLGLSQVYGFARSSGGEALIDSEPGVGTTVALVLPRTSKPIPMQVAPLSAVRQGPRERGRILLVEDDDSVADLVAQMLHELGYESLRAATAAAALKTLEDIPRVDLVFSDMVMPGELSGMDLAREIARRRPDLPVILTTGYSEAAAVAASGGVRLLVKPYRMETLAAELRATLQEGPAPPAIH